MGVTGLTSFIRRQSEFSTQINIIEEIEKHRREHGDAFIVFDFMGFIHVFGKNVTELSLGGRPHCYLQRLQIFLEKLTKAGASLIFICDGTLRTDRLDEWCDRRDREYEKSLRIMRGYRNEKDHLGCKSAVKSYLRLIEEKNYGNVVISTEFDCDAVVAKYANQYNALAIVASDSDFVIFEGPSKFWLTEKLNIDNMSARSYDRNKIRKFLNLTVDQMKILATIGGNDHSRQLSHLSRRYNDFQDVAAFCRLLSPELNNDLYYAVARRTKNQRLVTENELQIVARAINSYNIDFELPEETDAITKVFTSNVLMYAFYMGGNFQYDANFIDFNNNNDNPFIVTLLEVFRKLGGILLCDRREMRLNIVTKYEIDSNYKLKINEPIYPAAILEYETFAFGPHRIYYEIRWNMLFWSLGLRNLTIEQMEDLPKTHVVTVLTLSFLNKAGEISMKQADALLTMHHNIVTKEISFEDLKSLECDYIVEDTVRTAQLFNRATTLVWDCLQVCALTEFISLDTFDGYYYAILLEKVCSQHFYNECQERIQPYRSVIECLSTINNNE